jgi:hypothetical protein
MPAMAVTRSYRSFVAVLAAFVLLLCQTAFAAEACTNTIAPAAHDGSAAPCHERASSTALPAQLPSPGVCEAQAIPDAGKVHVPALTDLPAISIAYERAGVADAVTLAAQAVRPACHSPPLTVLHCRLRN